VIPRVEWHSGSRCPGNLVTSDTALFCLITSFTEVGEFSFDEAPERIRLYLASQLQSGLGQSLTLLQSYIDLQNSLVELEAELPRGG